MKTTSSPASYRYWTLFVSVCTRGIFSPARNVRSTTAPLARFLSLVRTNAPPLPGLTCWNSTIRQTSRSTSMCIPLRNWFVETVSATAASLLHGYELLGEAGQHLAALFRHHDEVLDANAAESRQIDARLDRD